MLCCLHRPNHGETLTELQNLLSMYSNGIKIALRATTPHKIALRTRYW